MPRLVATALVVLLVFPFRSLCHGDTLSDIRQAMEQHHGRVKAAEDEFNSQVDRSKKTTISKLESAAASAVRAGDLAAANLAWKNVLALDPQHQKATRHFESLGILEKTLAEAAHERRPTTIREPASQPPDAKIGDGWIAVPLDKTPLRAGWSTKDGVLSASETTEIVFFQIPRLPPRYQLLIRMRRDGGDNEYMGCFVPVGVHGTWVALNSDRGTTNALVGIKEKVVALAAEEGALLGNGAIRDVLISVDHGAAQGVPVASLAVQVGDGKAKGGTFGYQGQVSDFKPPSDWTLPLGFIGFRVYNKSRGSFIQAYVRPLPTKR